MPAGEPGGMGGRRGVKGRLRARVLGPFAVWKNGGGFSFLPGNIHGVFPSYQPSFWNRRMGEEGERAIRCSMRIRCRRRPEARGGAGRVHARARGPLGGDWAGTEDNVPTVCREVKS